MKVVFLQNIDGVAGSEKYFLAIIPALLKSGVDVEMCCVVKKNNKTKAQPFIDLLIEKEIPYSTISCGSYASPFVPSKISKRLRVLEADILHCHLIYADLWGAIIKRLLQRSVKVISTKHGYHETTYVRYCNSPENIVKNLYYYLFKFSHKAMDASYACSYGLVDFYTKADLIKPEEMAVIQHGFDYPAITKNSEAAVRFSKNQLIITGRLIERKGHHFILSIMPKLIAEFSDIVLVVLGNGELEEKLKAQVKTMKIEDSVKFTGFQSNVSDYLTGSDIMLMTSYSEGLPLVIFEAFNAQIPVISFDSIGCNELIDHENTGVIVPAFETDRLFEAIKKLLLNRNLCEKYTENAYLKLKTHLSLDRMKNETIQFYKNTINQ